MVSVGRPSCESAISRFRALTAARLAPFICTPHGYSSVIDNDYGTGSAGVKYQIYLGVTKRGEPET